MDEVIAPATVPGKGRRRFRILLWILVALPPLLLLAWMAWDRAGVVTLDRKIAELETSGYATSLAQMAPSKVPQDENAAP
ncbi:MAG TPA: hypothetical protein VFC86_14735, partial [Planctomycetota bacterium]|nr:hypothetical protein [Planctomycetota bacterium]